MRMFEIKRLCRPVAIAAALVGLSMPAAASEWNQKTILSFSEPVMIPGATLQPGSYVFELVDSPSTRQIVEIRNTNGSDPVTIALAVPAKRLEPNSNVVLQFEPTEGGEPPALKAWFFPGTLYGHEFVYHDQQAKEIAQRTKTLVLSAIPGTDYEKGTLRMYNASSVVSEWHGDPAHMRSAGGKITG